MSDKGDIAKAFIGWHFVDFKAVQKTTLAVIHAENSDLKLQALTDDRTHAYTEYLECLHQSRSIQTDRTETVVLTRPYRVLVKGTTPEHVATVCDIKNGNGEDIVIATGAHTVIEAHVVDSILQEVERHPKTKRDPATLQEHLSSNQGLRDELAANKSIRTLVLHFPALPAATLATVMHVAAILFTARSDAGARFRDRTSRVDANTSYYSALRTLLHTRCTHTA